MACCLINQSINFVSVLVRFVRVCLLLNLFFCVFCSGHAAMPSLFDGHASTITRFAARALFRAWPILIMNVCF